MGIVPQTIPVPNGWSPLIILVIEIAQVEEYPHMVTGGPEEIRNCPHMVTGIQEEIPYCSPGTSSGKQKKARSTSKPQFRSENTPATTETDQILIALQQLATNCDSANFNNDINRIWKLPKSLTTTMPKFDEKSIKENQRNQKLSHA